MDVFSGLKDYFRAREEAEEWLAESVMDLKGQVKSSASRLDALESAEVVQITAPKEVVSAITTKALIR